MIFSPGILLATIASTQDSAPAATESEPPALVVRDVAFTRDEVERLLEFSPLPEPPGDPTNAVYENEAAARLGQALFYDRRFSGPGTVACATCHDPARSWSDGKPLAEAVGALPRNTPSLWNVAYNRWFFWDGRKDTLWAQALTPLEDPREHAGSRLQYAHKLAEDPVYARLYEQVFGPLPDLSDRARFPDEGRPVPEDPEHPHSRAWASMRAGDQDTVNRIFANIGKTIAAFERELVSRSSPFDRFAQGVREGDAARQEALGASALRGLKTFLGPGRCHFCHDGPNFTDLEFHNNRVRPVEGAVDLARFRGAQLVQADPFNGAGSYSDAPEGLARTKIATLLQTDHNVGAFKTPTLRNVALSAPYMHEGQLATLAEVVAFYSTLEGAQPGIKMKEKLVQPLGLASQEQADLVAFLESLTDVALAPELFGPPAALDGEDD